MYALINANIFDGIHEELIRNAAIIIDGNRIKEILPECSRNPEDMELIDLGGRYVSPGFIDCHLHFMLDEVPDKERLLNYQSAGGVLFDNADSYVAFRSVEFAKKTLEAGFTTVIDGGGINYIDVALRDAIRLGYVEGPDYFICGKQITAWPSHFRGLSEVVSGPDEVRKMVRKQIYYSTDQIKLEMSAPIRSVGRRLEKSELTLDEIRAATDEAHSLGMLVQAHARGAKPVKDCLQGDVDLICHGTGMDDEAIQMMLDKGAYLLPTLGSPDPEPSQKLVDAKSARVVELLKATGRLQWESVKKAYQAGVKIAFSTDSGGVGNEHGKNAVEMLRMQKLGMSAIDILRSATSEAAKAMNLAGDRGVIETGMLADIAVMEENPLKKLETVCDVKMVIRNGNTVKKQF